MKLPELKFLAIPDEKSLETLWDLKNYFQLNGYRLGERTEAFMPHISMALGESNDPSIIEEIKLQSQELLKQYKAFEITATDLTRRPNCREDGKIKYYWIALVYDSLILRKISRELEEIFEDHKISLTGDYINGIHKMDPKSRGIRPIGNHLNICGKCVPEHVDYVWQKADSEAPKTITIEKIVLRENKQIIWEHEL